MESEKDFVERAKITTWWLKDTIYCLSSGFGSVVDIDESKELVLEKGQILIFGGDLVHAGADYSEENIRLHCYVLVKGIKQKKDATEAAAFASYMCEHCLLMCKSRRNLSNHIRYCDKKAREDHEGHSEEGQDKDGEAEIRCDNCGKSFRKWNTYYQHRRRARLKRLREEQETQAGDDSSD
ncbi:hypothetical protein DVH05_002019 [Phytophthora capsici]|nr:hypothetical protein DVH05_002019 [Phytophthora capsici]